MARFTRRTRRFRAQAAVAATALLALAACGSEADADSGEVGDRVKLISINPTTGLIAFAGTSANKGYELAVKEINEQDFLDGSTVELDFEDTKSEPQTAAQHMSQAVAGGDYSAVFGSVSSPEAVVMAPLAEKAKLPTIFTQAGSEGVVIGDYTYRATPLMSEYYPLLTDWLKNTGAKSIGIVYTGATPTLAEIGKTTLPQMAKDLGMEVTASVETPATTQDFAAPISQVLKSKPDIVSVLLAGAQNATAMTQLRQAGYDGPVIGNLGAGSGNLDPAGEAGYGIVWAANFHPDMKAESTQEFVKAYEAEYGEEPLNFAAEAYDAAWFLAKAIKEAGSSDPVGIQEAMAAIADEPFDGALGTGLRWLDRDLQVPGAAVELTADGEELMYEGEPVPSD